MKSEYVSVPLRGCSFEIVDYTVSISRNRRKVSVPLRGCSFEMRDMRSLEHYQTKFPSPCGDVVLK